MTAPNRWWIAAVLAWGLAACNDGVDERGTTAPVTPAAPAPATTVEVVYKGLDLPTSLEFLPDGRLLILERGFASKSTTQDARLAIVDVTRGERFALSGHIPAASHFDDETGNQGGAVGLALARDFSASRRVYVCYHHRDRTGALENRLSTFAVTSDRLDGERVLLDHVPGDETHNGCRVALDAAGHVYLTTGSLEPFDDALDRTRLSGKILRLMEDGGVPADNPFPQSLVWSYGHRNPQGLTFDAETGQLWSTEHGESSADELNRIERGANYGFPKCRGSAALGEFFRVEPVWADRLTITDGHATCGLSEFDAARYRPAFRTYYPDRTVGISDLVVYRGDAFPAWRGNLLVAMLAARQLMRVVVAGDKVAEEEVLLDERYGRIRDVTVGPDGFVYVLTNERGESDEDWKGHSRVLRLRPAASGRPN